MAKPKWSPEEGEDVRVRPTATRGAMVGRVLCFRADGLGVDIRDRWSGGIYPIKFGDLKRIAKLRVPKPKSVSRPRSSKGTSVKPSTRSRGGPLKGQRRPAGAPKSPRKVQH